MRAGALQKALKIIAVLEHRGSLRFGELRDELGLSDPTLAAMLKIFVTEDMLQKLDGGYRLGPRFLRIANRIVDRNDVRRLARPILEQLREDLGDRVELCLPAGLGLLFVEVLEGTEAMDLYVRPGIRLNNLNALAPGKLLLAYSRKDERDAFYASAGFWRPTAKALKTKTAVERQLREVKATGYAEDHEEARPGIVRLAAAVFDHAGKLAAVISLVLPAAKSKSRRNRKVRKALLAAAGRVSNLLGYDASREES